MVKTALTPNVKYDNTIQETTISSKPNRFSIKPDPNCNKYKFYGASCSNMTCTISPSKNFKLETASANNFTKKDLQQLINWLLDLEEEIQ